MPIEIRMSGQDAEDELASLCAWLRDDQDLRGHARISLRGDGPRPEEMGSAFDVIQLVVDGGFQALNFAVTYATWRATRRSHPRVTITYEGTRVSLSDEPETVDVIVRALNRAEM